MATAGVHPSNGDGGSKEALDMVPDKKTSTDPKAPMPEKVMSTSTLSSSGPSKRNPSALTVDLTLEDDATTTTVLSRPKKVLKPTSKYKASVRKEQTVHP